MIRPSFAWGDCALVLLPKKQRQSKLTRVLIHQGEELLKVKKLLNWVLREMTVRWHCHLV